MDPRTIVKSLWQQIMKNIPFNLQFAYDFLSSVWKCCKRIQMKNRRTEPTDPYRSNSNRTWQNFVFRVLKFQQYFPFFGFIYSMQHKHIKWWEETIEQLTTMAMATGNWQRHQTKKIPGKMNVIRCAVVSQRSKNEATFANDCFFTTIFQTHSAACCRPVFGALYHSNQIRFSQLNGISCCCIQYPTCSIFKPFMMKE